MVFASVQTRIRIALVVTSLFVSAPCTTYAAPKKPDFTLPAQVNAAVQPLLAKARESVASAFTRVKAVDSKTRDLDTIGRSLEEKLRTNRQAFEKANENNDAALDALYSAKVSGTTVSGILQLTASLRDQVENFRKQAIDDMSPDFISGDLFRSRRRAMSSIVVSEKDYLGQVSALVRDTSSWLARVEGDLRSTSGQSDPRALPLGFDHYLTLVQQSVDAHRTQLVKVSPFFNGKDPEGRDQQPTFQCSDGDPQRFRSFSGDLGVVQRWAQAPTVYTSNDPAVYSWVRLMTDGALVAYDGNSQTGEPGYIAGWTSCINSKRNNIDFLANDIRRALDRGELELAKTLDLQRAQLEFEKTVLEAQLRVITHRREQLVRIMSSAGAQAIPENLTQYPDAWRKTISAHAKDLDDVAATFPELISTAIALVDTAQSEISSLAGLEDWEQIQIRLNTVSRNLEIIRTFGFERLLSQLESVDESLETMGRGISDGSSSLNEALEVYKRATATKVDYFTTESAGLPAKITAAESLSRTTGEALSKARGDLNKSQQNTKLFQSERAKLVEAMRLYYTKFGVARLNPIYTALVTELMKRAASKKAVVKQKADLDRLLQQTLSSFNGTTLVPEPAKNCRKGSANCPKPVKIKNSAAKALLSAQKKMLPEVSQLVSSISVNVAGISLSDLVTKIETTHRTLAGLK